MTSTTDELVLAEILDLGPDDEVDLTGLATELTAAGITDLADPTNEHLIVTAAAAHTYSGLLPA